MDGTVLSPLLVDLYELTMAEAYRRTGLAEVPVHPSPRAPATGEAKVAATEVAQLGTVTLPTPSTPPAPGATAGGDGQQKPPAPGATPPGAPPGKPAPEGT